MSWWLMLKYSIAAGSPQTTAQWVPVLMSSYAAMSAAAIGATLRGPFNSRTEAKEAA